MFSSCCKCVGVGGEKIPCSKLKKLREGSGRTRFLSQDELSVASYILQRQQVDHPELEVIVLIAVTTGHATWRNSRPATVRHRP